MEKRIVILGSTGSIGRAALEVVQSLAPMLRVVGLAAHRNWELLARQADQFGVRDVAIADASFAASLRSAVSREARIHSGAEGLVELVRDSEANFVLSAIVGAAGLPATLAAVECGIDVGLANKESLVVAGSLLMPLARERGSKLIPVDSEHSAIYQSLHGGRRQDVKRIHLTASGGPFRTWDKGRIQNAALEDALKHPTWSMGAKITIDSASMMNKALEIIEAHHLFGLQPEQIDVLIHPESIIHSMVEYVDGSVIAQLGVPDMKTPIQYAFTQPARLNGITKSLDWRKLRTLSFEPPDVERFPAIRLGYEAARRGGTAGAVLNAANESAVQLFREGRIPFGQITVAAERALREHEFEPAPTLRRLLEADAWARQEVVECTTCS